MVLTNPLVVCFLQKPTGIGINLARNMEKSMDRAVIFDLYETLVTENHPEWHAEAPTPGERLGLS